jgi:serine/threonine protein kinase
MEWLPDRVIDHLREALDTPDLTGTPYVLDRELGRGGMGTVYLARDTRLGRAVALKVLSPMHAEAESVERLWREARILAGLEHPGIVPIHDVGTLPDGRAYYVMKLVEGRRLDEYLQARPSLLEVCRIFLRICEPVEFAHAHGIVHRDLKPANIMLTSDKWPYVMDFGLAKAIQAESSISVSGAVMGTPAYMPPEQAQGQLDQIDAKSDVYSLGATMYAVLCKKQPFTGQTPMEILMKVCKEDPPPMRSHNPEIPEEVEKIVLKAMAKEKGDRYASSQALADDLKRYLSNQEIEAKGPSSLKLAAKKAKRNVWPLLLVSIVLVAGGVIGYLVIHKPPPPPPVVISRDPDPKPPVVITPPAPEDTKGRMAMEWFNTWAKLTDFIDYDDWKAGDATLAERVHQHLVRMKEDAPLREGDVRIWFSNQTDKAETQMGRLQGPIEEKRQTASRIVGWCDTILAGSKGIDFLKRSADSAAKTRGLAATVANYKGSFTLRIMVGPFVEVTRLTRNGKDVPLGQRFTPLVVGNLEVGDFEVELSHPELGKKTEKIPATLLKDGKIFQLTGRIQDPKLRVTELP